MPGKPGLRRRTGLAGALALLLSIAPTVASALELVVLSAVWCPVCERWNDEVGGIYAKTAEGKQAPMRRIDWDTGDKEIEALQLKAPLDSPPVFLLVKDNVELARIEGYHAEDFFYGELDVLLKKFSGKQ